MSTFQLFIKENSSPSAKAVYVAFVITGDNKNLQQELVTVLTGFHCIQKIIGGEMKKALRYM